MARVCSAKVMTVAVLALGTAAGALCAQVNLFSGVASASGQNNTVWRTEVYLDNRGEVSGMLSREQGELFDFGVD